MRALILNADDFGLTPGINEGIIEAHQKGLLTSATLMANGLAFEKAVYLAQTHPALDLGIHLTLTWGKPLSARSHRGPLVTKRGNFQHSLLRLWIIASRSQEQKRIKEELQAQIERVLEKGITPSHFDSHKHIHILPPILEILLEIGEEYQIRRCRCPLEASFGKDLRAPIKGRLRAQILAPLARRARKRLYQQGWSTPDSFYGVALTGAWTVQKLEEVLRHLPPGVTEVMFHPGKVDPLLSQLPTRLVESREKELAVLRDDRLKRVKEEEQIHLISYRILEEYIR